MEAAHANKKSVKAAVAYYMRFQQYCGEHHLPTSPPTYESVGNFLADYFSTHKNRASSISGILSALRTQYRSRRAPFLTPAEEEQLRHLRQQMALADVTGVQRVTPLRFSHIQAAVALMDLTQLGQLQEATTVAFAQNTLLRTAEITSGITAGDILWFKGHNGLRLTLRSPTKTSRLGSGIQIEVGESTDPSSGIALLRRLWVARNLANNPDEYVFCAQRKGTLLPTVKASGTAFRASIKRMVASIGLDPSRFSGHSPRGGGATDLFTASLPYYVIKKTGRWTKRPKMTYDS